MGASARSEFISFPSFGFPCGFLLLFTFLPLYFFIYKGLDLLKKVGALQEEAQKLDMEAEHLEACGLEKMEVAVAGSEVEGFYGLLMGAMSDSPCPQPCLLIRKSVTPHLPPISHPPLQESKEPDASWPC